MCNTLYYIVVCCITGGEFVYKYDVPARADELIAFESEEVNNQLESLYLETLPISQEERIRVLQCAFALFGDRYKRASYKLERCVNKDCTEVPGYKLSFRYNDKEKVVTDVFTLNCGKRVLE